MAVLWENRFKLSHIPCFNIITVSLMKLHEISVVTAQKKDAFPIVGGIAKLEICAGGFTCCLMKFITFGLIKES